MSDSWVDFLNPDLVRQRFVRAGLFLVAHEMLLHAIKAPLHDFLADTWTAEGGWKTSFEYTEKVLALDPKGKKDPTRASIAWLLEMGVIEESDEITIRELTEERNRLAHELRNVVNGSHQHDFESLFPKIVALATKIDRWWIMNVEITTDPDHVDAEIGEDDVTPGSLMLLQVLAQVALGKDDEAWQLYHEFMAKRDGSA